MTTAKIGLYAGSFDPPTNGHEWVIKTASDLFDQVVVGVASNPDKNPFLDSDHRAILLQNVAKGLSNVEVKVLPNEYTATYAKSIGATHLIRGVRNGADYDYERSVADLNKTINPNLQTILLVPPNDLSSLSSSLVKGLIGPIGWEDLVYDMVPKSVYDALILQRAKKLWKAMEVQGVTTFNKVVNCYNAPNRHYHNLEHIVKSLELIPLMQNVFYPNALREAIWFHDIVYNPKSDDNEVRSADMAQVLAVDIGRTYYIEDVKRLIMATNLTYDSEHLDAPCIQDIDLAILGANPKVYKRYADNIRKEYEFVPEDLYKVKRKEIKTKNNPPLKDPLIVALLIAIIWASIELWST